MEARLIRATLLVAAVLSLGASHRTENFLVTTTTAEFAREVALTAEKYRRDLAIEWLGHELPPWQDICPITVHVGPQFGAGGATTFSFANGRPFGWIMTIQGSRERVLDSVLPHEITHTIFATHFGCPLPRWADEGACTTVEDISERQKQHNMLYEFLTTNRGIAFNDMFAMREYPRDVLPLYSQGYSLVRFLLAQGGKRKFVAYVGDGLKWNNWTKAGQEHYGYSSLSELQVTWLDWVRRGSPELPEASILVAQANEERQPSMGTPAVAQEASPVQQVSPAAVASLNPASASNATSVANSGWYARVRDETLASRRQSGNSSANLQQAQQAGDLVQAGSIARPQGIGRAQQIVLEWSSSNPVSAAPAQLQQAVPPPLAPQTSRLVPDFGGTIWR